MNRARIHLALAILVVLFPIIVVIVAQMCPKSWHIALLVFAFIAYIVLCIARDRFRSGGGNAS